MVDKKKGLKGKGVKKNKAHDGSVNEGNRFTPIEQGTLEKMRNGADKFQFYDTAALEAMDRFGTKQGKLYKKEKLKVKRGNAALVGTISQRVNSVKFLEGGDDGDPNGNDQQGGAASNTARSGQKTGGGEAPRATNGSAQPKKGPTRIVFSD